MWWTNPQPRRQRRHPRTVTITVGSVCSGIGGLELALGLAGGDYDLRWVAEIDDAASNVLAHRFPGIPNVGDWTTADLEPVDLIIGGLPCQPVSQAGQRAGTDDERWLFDDLARIVSRMGPQPRLFLENVPGLLTANSGNAMARIVHSLAKIGYVGRYGLLPASAVGACHRRSRWFCHAAADTANNRHERAGGTRRRGPRPANGGASVADTDSATLRTQLHSQPETRINIQPGDDTHRLAIDTNRAGIYGPFQPAINRWEHILGRPAPNPQDTKRRLNPAFVEWMMGYPQGWVTDTDISRSGQLHTLGNAVVPQQAAAALTALTQPT